MVILATTAAAQEWRAWPDSGFAPIVGDPAFPDGDGPAVLFDAGHDNYHTLHGLYLAFARLLERDGYRVRELTGHVDADQTTEAWREIRFFRLGDDGRLTFVEPYDVTHGGEHVCDHARRLEIHPDARGGRGGNS